VLPTVSQGHSTPLPDSRLLGSRNGSVTPQGDGVGQDHGGWPLSRIGPARRYATVDRCLCPRFRDDREGGSQLGITNQGSERPHPRAWRSVSLVVTSCPIRRAVQGLYEPAFPACDVHWVDAASEDAALKATGSETLPATTVLGRERSPARFPRESDRVSPASFPTSWLAWQQVDAACPADRKPARFGAEAPFHESFRTACKFVSPVIRKTRFPCPCVADPSSQVSIPASFRLCRFQRL
jgi:hypothetical protein